MYLDRDYKKSHISPEKKTILDEKNKALWSTRIEYFGIKRLVKTFLEVLDTIKSGFKRFLSGAPKMSRGYPQLNLYSQKINVYLTFIQNYILNLNFENSAFVVFQIP